MSPSTSIWNLGCQSLAPSPPLLPLPTCSGDLLRSTSCSIRRAGPSMWWLSHSRPLYLHTILHSSTGTACTAGVQGAAVPGQTNPGQPSPHVLPAPVHDRPRRRHAAPLRYRISSSRLLWFKLLLLFVTVSLLPVQDTALLPSFSSSPGLETLLLFLLRALSTNTFSSSSSFSQLIQSIL